MWPWMNTQQEPTCKPLTEAPPDAAAADGGVSLLPCKPTLVFGDASDLGHVLRNDLVFASTSTFFRYHPTQMEDGNDKIKSVNNHAASRSILTASSFDHGIKLAIVNFVDDKSLVNLTKVFGGSKMIDMNDIYDEEGDVKPDAIAELQQQQYQAIVIPDYAILESPLLRNFCYEQYHKSVAIVVMSIMGIYQIAPLRVFGVSWRTNAYTKRTLKLTEYGKMLISSDAFPFAHKYCKALFVESPDSNNDRMEEVFCEHVDPADYIQQEQNVDDDDDSSFEPDPIPDPEPGSPVVVHVDGTKSISYFGFVNSLDVSYGAIILRLCYAAAHHHTAAAAVSA